MSVPLRTLVIEDEKEDVTLVAHELRRAGYEPDIRRVETEAALLTALGEQAWDIVIADYTLPQFDGLTALRLVRQRSPDVPFILVSGTIGEEMAVLAMRAGADDYVFKGNLRRLAPAVEREMTTWRVRRQHQDELARRAEALEAANRQLQEEQAERARVEAELRLAQKLEAIGQLAAGIAHEINTPMQYVGDSVHFLRDAFEDLLQLIDIHDQTCTALAELPEAAGLLARVAAAAEGIDLPYLRHRGPQAFERALEGIDRVGSIVRAMQDFAHPDTSEKALTDLNQALETALVVARHEYKYVADVEADLDALPLVPCHPGELHQVFLGLILNAAYAVGQSVLGTDRRGRIRVSTSVDGDVVVIRIADSGTGIPPEIQQRIFDPFFTTKPPGHGAGQGLAVARSIVVGKHGGSLTFQSEIGVGTTFTIRLPVADPTPEGSTAPERTQAGSPEAPSPPAAQRVGPRPVGAGAAPGRGG